MLSELAIRFMLGGKYDHTHLISGGLFAELRQELVSIGHRHVQVQDDDVRRERMHGSVTQRPVQSAFNLETGQDEQFL